MGIFDLDTDRIVRIFHNNGIKMSLKKAFEVANIIYEAHLNRLNEVENNAWNLARKEADERVRVAAEANYNEGLRDGERRATYMADNGRIESIISATLWVEENISARNLEKKIRCIKELRNKFTTLSLRDCKTIIDNATGNGAGMYF